jgi:protein-tyrosine phosphatase
MSRIKAPTLKFLFLCFCALSLNTQAMEIQWLRDLGKEHVTLPALFCATGVMALVAQNITWFMQPHKRAIEQEKFIPATLGQRSSNSQLVTTSLLGVATLSSALSEEPRAAIFLAGALLMQIAKERKPLAFELSLLQVLFTEHEVKEKATSADRWNMIYEEEGVKLYLGMIPLNNFDHYELLRKAGIKAVLSLVEDFELCPSLFADPVQASQWKEGNCEYLQVPACDFSALSAEHFQEGIEFIEKSLSCKKDTYVHCKAGRGRSAACVVAFLIKKKLEKIEDENIDIDNLVTDTQNEILKKRKIVLNNNQRNAIIKFTKEKLIKDI